MSDFFSRVMSFRIKLLLLDKVVTEKIIRQVIKTMASPKDCLLRILVVISEEHIRLLLTAV